MNNRLRPEKRAGATPARRCAQAVVRRVFEQGAYADRAFRGEAERAGLEPRDRAFAMRLAYGTVQMNGTVDWVLQSLARRPLEKLDPPVLAALRLGLYELLYMGTPDRAAVSEAVELVKATTPHAHAFVNAILRRATVEGPALVGGLDDSMPPGAALAHSHPLWVTERWFEELGPEAARELMRFDNEPAESSLRANHLRTDAAAVIELLAEEGVAARTDALAPEAIVLGPPYDVHGSRLFAEGLVMPQSRASMLVARAVDPRPGERVLDLCAAPGSKTTHLAALMRGEGEVVAVEADPARAEGLAENSERLGAAAVRVVVGDATEPAFGDGYDHVLVDPPCSDLGTLQSRPDARWRKTAVQVEELRVLQRRILEAGAQAVAPGGRLVYSTCTISAAENERQLQEFLGSNMNFRVCDLTASQPRLAHASVPGFLQTLPHRDGTDGFFIAALERTG
jgi:16S rRNA (cytosine967-C5)-methyltransferase